MSDALINPSPGPRTRKITLFSLILLGFSALILLAGAYAYHLAMEYNALRTDCLIALMVAGVGATACFAGIIYLLNPRLDQHTASDGEAAPPAPPRWHVRLLIDAVLRLLMVLQLLAMALALFAAGILIFGKKIPGAP